MQIGESIVFNYTGTVQKILLSDFRQLNADNIMPPLYKLECYGAQGGGNGSYGNYTCGYLQIEKPTELYLYIGGQGGVDINTYGWNSNGNGRRDVYTHYDYQGYNGSTTSYTEGYCSGGATDIAFKGVDGSTNWNTSEHLNNILLRAKGGTGYSRGTSNTNLQYSNVWVNYGTRTSFSRTDTITTSSKAIMRFYLADVYANWKRSTSTYYTKKQFEALYDSDRTRYNAITRAISNGTKYDGHYWFQTSNSNVYTEGSTVTATVKYSYTLLSDTKSATMWTTNHSGGYETGYGATDSMSCTNDDHINTTSQETLYFGYENRRTTSDINNGRYPDKYAKVSWTVTSNYSLRAEVYTEVLWSYLVTTYYGGTCNYDNYFDTRLQKQTSQSNVRSGNGMIRITRIAYTDLYKNSDIRFDSKIPNIMDYTDILNSFIQ